MRNFPSPAKYTGTVINKEYLNYRVIKLTINPNGNFSFVPGQFVNLEVALGKFRPYSISSNSSNESEIEFMIGLLENGLGSEYVRKLNQGDRVVLIGPSGRFSLSEDALAGNCKELLFVATSTGIAPFLSMFHELEEAKVSSRIKLLFGVRDPKEIFALDKLEKFKQTLPYFDYEVCLSSAGKRVTAILPETYQEGREVYLCGNPNMVAEASQLLESRKFPANKIFHEKFTLRV